MSIFILFKLLGSLALLMFGMKTMSEALQKLTGDRLRHILGTMTKNRFTGLLTGTFITASVQSSTATTVMVVSFVNAGLLTLAQAISVIMGANIGTTITAWIMSIFGFQINMSDYIYVLFAIGIPLIFSKRGGRKSFGEFLFGFSFMFLGLTTLRENALEMDLGHNAAVMNFIASCKGWGFLSTLIFLLIGGILTMCAQSSAAVMAITLILCSEGVLDIYQGIALVMGENIGTTVTSNIAALSANVQARRAALAHLIFNVFGVIWVLCLYHPFINLVTGLVDRFAGNVDMQIRVTYYLSAFHTMFNLCNVLLLIWFIKPFEKIVTFVIKPKEDDTEFRLRYIAGGLLSTAELSILQATKETNLFAERVRKMFNMVVDLLGTEKDEDFEKIAQRIEKYEDICDRMEIEIANYLNKVSEGRLSPESKFNISTMLREVSELESIGDACYNLSRSIARGHSMDEDFTAHQYENIRGIMHLDAQAIEQMIAILERPDKLQTDIKKAYEIESDINGMRDSLKDKNILSLGNKEYSYQLGVYYMDIVAECEKLGDYVINVVEANADTKEKRAS